ncbi:MAG: hypothetical protein NT163_04685 [Chlorobiales bacterium]|nr:hypothetical protein [Chlorobiales bacterium]
MAQCYAELGLGVPGIKPNEEHLRPMRNAQTLEEDVNHVLDGFGIDYGMTFC